MQLAIGIFVFELGFDSRGNTVACMGNLARLGLILDLMGILATAYVPLRAKLFQQRPNHPSGEQFKS